MTHNLLEEISLTQNLIMVITPDRTRKYGMLRYFPMQGWLFFPSVSGRKPGRKYHSTPIRALPKWIPETARFAPPSTIMCED